MNRKIHQWMRVLRVRLRYGIRQVGEQSKVHVRVAIGQDSGLQDR